jgi:RES domain-containing protein
LGILELERFTSETLNRWNALSQDLDELQAALHFGVMPEQRRLRRVLIETLQQTPRTRLVLTGWVRIVTYRYSMEPLSAAGSLHGYGGRFNAGADLDPGTLDPWPALYIAENQETAFRERFQIASTGTVDGLSPQELALAQSTSYSTVFLNGELHDLFDMTSPSSLEAVAKVLGRIRMPAKARFLQKKLRISATDLRMIRTGQQLYDNVLTRNWRTLPVQFGLPAAGHVLAELIRAAGFGGILYRSTKGPARCVAVFPGALSSDSFVELAGDAPVSVKHVRLDIDSGEELSGWDTLPMKRQR